VTLLLVELVEPAPLSLKRFQEIFRPLCRGHGGQELLAEGGSLQLAFGRASDALSAAITGRRSLIDSGCPQSEVAIERREVGALRVRMALHTGEVEPGQDARHSPVLRHATHLLTAAHPGQILLSEKCAAVLKDAIRPTARLVNIGLYHLQRKLPPEHLFQADDLDQPCPGLLSPRAVPAGQNSLPPQFTRFFDRERELAQLHRLIHERESRLVTLTGLGGSGKTRLAIEFAHRVWDRFQGVVWFVPLADLVDPRLIVAEILKGLGRPQSSDTPGVEEMVDVLSGQPAILILDSFEHLIAEGTATIRTLLERVPTLVVLVTSRRSFKLDGGQELPVRPFSIPGPDENPEDLLRYASVQLFVDRAQAARPDFQLTQRNAAAVSALCRELEGVPLALELAAARSHVMTPQQMLARMTQRFELLVSRRPGSSRRHHSLRAAIQWSYELLPPKMQRFFARLSIFRGGWLLEAAENICQEPAALDYLEHLCECSLILAEEAASSSRPGELHDGEPGADSTIPHLARLPAVSTEMDLPVAGIRFRLLETLREYGIEQLTVAERQELELRHAQYYACLAEQGEAELLRSAQEAWLNHLETEQSNLRAALLWCEERRETELGLRLAGALWRFWYVRGHWSIGRTRLAGVLALPGASCSAARAKALHGAGVLAHYQGDIEVARRLLHESLAIGRALGERQLTAATLTSLGFLARDQGEPLPAGTLFSEALTLGREVEDRRGIAMALAGLGDVALYQRSPGAARSFYQESLAIRRSLDDPRFLAAALNNLADLDRVQDPAAARSLYEESLPIMRRLGSKGDVAWTLCGLAYSLLSQGDLPRAEALLVESLQLQRELENRRGMAECLEGLAAIAGRHGRHLQSVGLFGAAEALREEIHMPASPAHRAENDQYVATARAHMTVEQFLSTWAAGRAMTPEQAVSQALEEVCRPGGLEITPL
jgi:predicted ATPase